MTTARSGAIFGGTVVGLLSTIVIGGCLLLGMPWAPIPAPVATMAVYVGLSTLLGCLAGALCFATDTKPVVLGETHGHEHGMQQLGADPVGRPV